MNQYYIANCHNWRHKCYQYIYKKIEQSAKNLYKMSKFEANINFHNFSKINSLYRIYKPQDFFYQFSEIIPFYRIYNSLDFFYYKFFQNKLISSY